VRGGGSPLILVVDDNEAGQFLARAVLEASGFLVDTAGSSPEVLERLAARPPDMILMDVQLPGQDGLALTRQLKADPSTAAIPIVALTAHAMPGDRELALAAGCIGYISKPIDTRTLGDRIRSLLPVEQLESLPSH
jgi:CheY-like chemotaxis protein